MTIIYLNIAGTEMIEICLSPKEKKTQEQHITNTFELRRKDNNI